MKNLPPPLPQIDDHAQHAARTEAMRRGITHRIDKLEDDQKLAHAREFEGLAEKHMWRCVAASFALIAFTSFDGASGDGINFGPAVIDAKHGNFLVAALGMIALYSMHRYWLHKTRSEALYPLDILTYRKVAAGPYGASSMTAILATLGGFVTHLAFLIMFGCAVLFSAPSVVAISSGIYERSGTAAIVDEVAMRLERSVTNPTKEAARPRAEARSTAELEQHLGTSAR